MAVLLIFIPLFASLLFLFIKGSMGKTLALTVSVLNLIFSIYLLSSFDAQSDEGFQFAFDQPWVESLGISFCGGLDGISLLMILLTNLLIPIILLSSWGKTPEYPAAFYGLVLLMQAGLNGVFMATDGLLFYVFWELTLIPIWFICAYWGGENRIPVTIKFFIYTFAGSLFMLVGLIYLYLNTPGYHNFTWEALQMGARSLDAAGQQIVFWLIFAAFAVKIPIFPFHTWQPETYTVSPAPGTMLLSGIMLKMGIYGVIRWLLPFAPDMVPAGFNFPIILCIIGIVYGGWIAIKQTDMKKIAAYSSLSHVGLIAAGVFTLTIDGLQGAVIQMVNHGINIVGLFIAIELIERRTGTRDLTKLGGIASKAPKLSILFMIIVLGSLAVPLTNGFVGEFLLLKSLYSINIYMAAIAGLTVIFCAVYMLRLYNLAIFGEVTSYTANIKDINSRETIILSLIALLVIILGVYPQPIFDISKQAIETFQTTMTLK
ncbi:MAG: NADH-quinone oxidoreductase subunit M [Bacteroidota bacterium]|nr:NADH-quinone oxidoreductase subunit M [Bacteroidota bacterium]